MEIIFQAHNADVSPRLRARATHAVRKAATRLPRIVDAVIRFEEDGPDRRVELLVRAPRRRPIIAQARADRYDDALQGAVTRLEARLRQLKRLQRASRVAPPRSPYVS